MTKYLKHYWKKNGNWLTTANEVEQHHPEADYPGLGVKVWMHDSDGIDVCLSEVPDSTEISTITVGSKNAVIEITETQFNSVKTPLDEAGVLRHEADKSLNRVEIQTPQQPRILPQQQKKPKHRMH